MANRVTLYIQTGQYQHQFFAVNNGGNFRFTNNDNIWVASNLNICTLQSD